MCMCMCVCVHCVRACVCVRECACARVGGLWDHALLL